MKEDTIVVGHFYQSDDQFESKLDEYLKKKKVSYLSAPLELRNDYSLINIKSASNHPALNGVTFRGNPKDFINILPLVKFYSNSVVYDHGEGHQVFNL